MDIVRVMNENLANQIAAGEVVEKCMNVVKELVENSIDAKSSVIEVLLIDSGVREIKVIDNGIGMSKNDAVLAFSRHATSKVTTLDDLFNISSLGFRGEALPSIASVSNVILKTTNQEEKTLVEVSGGDIKRVEKTDIDKGTSITVTNLFYNTPVRLKYLKNIYLELANITDYINKMALSFPNIKFILKNNDKTILNTDGSGRLLKVINDIYGINVTKKMINIKGENDDYLINGFISYPEIQKSNKNLITTLINGRVIKNFDLIKCITDSYHTYMPSDKFPIAVLQIEVDPILIDVNIHPTKMNIKFSKFESLKELLQTLIRNELEKLTLIPDAVIMTQVDNNKTYINTNVIETEKFEYDFDKKNKEYEEFEKITLNLEVKESSVNYEKKEDNRLKEIYPVGLVHGTYIIGENEDGMYIIDQHAANERVNYEYYLKEMSNPKNDIIDLLVPINIELTSNEFIILKTRFDILDRLNIIYEEFGFNTILIRSIPLWLNKSNLDYSIKQIIDIIVYNGDFSIDKFIDHVAATLACKASIKANDHITIDDMAVLIKRLRECDNPFTCPHGRPTVITYHKYDLEKLFKRVM